MTLAIWYICCSNTFIEYLRLEMLVQVILAHVLRRIGVSFGGFVRSFLNTDVEADSWDILKDERRMNMIEGEQKDTGSAPSGGERRQRIKNIIAIERMSDKTSFFKPKEAGKDVTLGNLTRRCINADPNYGTSWFFCRQCPCDSPSFVLDSALRILAHDFTASHEVCTRAVLRYTYKKISSDPQGEHASLLEDFESAYNEMGISLEENKLPLLESNGNHFALPDFATALVEHNKSIFSRYLDEEQRRAVLFGSDQIIP